MQNNKYGCIDKTGQEVIPCQYEEGFLFIDGLASVKLNGKYGYIDKTGQEVVPCKYDYVELFSEGFAPVFIGDYDFPFGDGIYGFVDESGQEIVPCKYDKAGDFSEGLAAVEMDGKWGYYDKTGRELVPCIYDDALPFFDGYAAVMKNGKYGCLVTGANPAADVSDRAFIDVAADIYYAKPVAWAVEQGITSGTGDGEFSPDKACTQAEILTFLWRAKGSPEPAETASLPGAEAGAYYEKAARWALEQGMIDSSFSAETPCTRAVAVTFLWKQAGSPASERPAFSDVPAESDYAQAVAWAVEKGVTSGTGSGRFSPDKICSRGEIAAFLYRTFTD